MALEFVRLSDVLTVESLSNDDTVLIESNNDIKRIAANKISSGNITTELLTSSDIDELMAQIK